MVRVSVSSLSDPRVAYSTVILTCGKVRGRDSESKPFFP